MISKCLLTVALVSSVVHSVPVTQEEYARYISQQQIARLSDKPQSAPRRPVLVQVPAYQPAAAAASPRPIAYQPQPQYQQAYPTPSYQTQQEPEDYQEPEQYQPLPRPKAYPKTASKSKPAYKPNKQEEEEADNDPNAQYQFSFDISDDESTNYHNRKETRDGQKISGSYSVVDSDGFIRTVTYTADPEEGFKAEVSREPTNIQVKIPAPTPQPAAPAPQYRLAERKPQPQYITLPQGNEQESDEQPSVQPISGYYRQAQPLLSKAPAHRFAAGPRPQPSKANAFGYATNPSSAPVIYQAYQQ
ncbi:cuticle protein 8 isoform X1 [Daktulosphaira vitifoliae]|uniref:cuticle protein 8 isoform X1 n=1 Tax=Daktulosphaira vitifoliae TaxID=58002 RepID=UPI0021AAD411|nr:cuticle protein 8 isoform X1 [Daktulosphaira vitifoliae]